MKDFEEIHDKVVTISENPRTTLPVALLSSTQTLQLLAETQCALARGNSQLARPLAYAALTRAAGAGDRKCRADAYMYLARADMLESRMSSSLQFSELAAQDYELLSRGEDVADVMSLQSYTSSSLGMGPASLDRANRSIEIREDLGSPLVQAVGFNYYGVAAFWSSDFRLSAEILEASRWFAADANDNAAQFHPLVNKCFSDVLELFWNEQLVGKGMQSLAPVSYSILECRMMMREGLIGTLNLGITTIALMLVEFCQAFLQIRQNDFEGAGQSIRASIEHTRGLDKNSWLWCLTWWIRADLARALNKHPRASMCVGRMATAAQAGEHQPMATIARVLAAESHKFGPGNSVLSS